MGVLTGIMTGLTGGLQLYSGVKGLFSDKQKEARRALANARAAEQAWFRRNYYGDYLNNSIARAAIKRVENTLSRNSRQNMDNMMTNLAAQESTRREAVDAQHLQNMNNLSNRQASLDMNRNTGLDPEIIGGLSLIEKAIAGANWGREEDDEDKNNSQTTDSNANV